MIEMLTPAFLQGGFKIVLAIVGIMAARMMLSQLDKSEKFKDVINGISPENRGTYYGLRFVGVCILFGLILS